jgi:hypothetical protein
MHHRMLAATGAAIAALACAAPAVAAPPPIQPGASIESEGGYCTLNWIYDGTGAQAGKVYAGTAAHCVSRLGQVVNLSDESLGTAIEPIGTVAFIGDQTVEGRDYAFIEIDADDLGQVDAAMKGHPQIPTGVATAPRKGDVIQFSGYGVASQATQPTREQRVGVLNRFGATEHDVIGLVSPGDSGGPVADVTNGNTALGIVDTVGAGLNSDALSVVTAGEGGANLAFVLQDAAAHGFGVRLRTA